MVTDPYHAEPPFEYECIECQERFVAAEMLKYDRGDELVECPGCGGTLWNLTTPDGE